MYRNPQQMRKAQGFNNLSDGEKEYKSEETFLRDRVFYTGKRFNELTKGQVFIKLSNKSAVLFSR